MSSDSNLKILEQYEKALQPSRDEMKQKVFSLFTTHTDAKFWLKFLIAYCAQGVHMTKDVPLWIDRAGESAIRQGHKEFGQTLRGHAKGEEGHHELYIDDVKNLVKLYKKKFGEDIAEHSIPWNPPQQAVKDYIKFHEDIISSALPLRQVALEYEIEMLSVSIGGDLFAKFLHICGPETAECLSFITEHVAADVGHTKFNRILLDKILNAHKESQNKFVETGVDVLKIYTNYILGAAKYAETQM